jgi:acyl-coenzyme A thioesterase PaaI-like protein
VADEELTAPPAMGFIAALGLELWTDESDGFTHGRAEVRPEMFAPGTDRLRLGALATLADVVGGTLPSGPVNPTVDLRVQLLAPAPTTGELHLIGRTAREGRRLIVGEVSIDAGDGSPPFARSIYTFVNRKIPNLGAPEGAPPSFGARPRVAIDVPAIEDMFGVSYLDIGVAELGSQGSTRNGVWGTVQGGAQAWFGEMAAEQALGEAGRGTARDVDIRFLNRMEVGPLRATAEVVPTAGPEVVVRVPLTDAGNDDALVSLVTLICRRP